MTQVVLPWPHRDLSPNGQHGHWAQRATAKKHARGEAFFLAIQAGVRINLKATSAKVTVTFHPPDARRRDKDNCISSCKAYFDGIADALGIDDSKWDTTYPPMGQPVDRGSVVLDISA